MFDISWGKLVIIGVVALIVIGPKELPGVLRQLGQMMAKIRRMAGEFQGQFQEAMREAEMADLKKQFDETTSSLQSAASSMASAFDPTPIKNEMEKLIEDPLKDVKDPMQLDSSVATSTPATPPTDPTAPLPTPATAAAEATQPTDPVALGTAPAAPASPLPAIDVPMPELPPPVDPKDFAPTDAAPKDLATAEPSSAPATPAPGKPEGDKAA
jgi:sec-independent protein translocase protein TatB